MRDPDADRRPEPDPLAGLPPDDYLVVARRADRELADKIAAECRRPEQPWARDVMGPTEAWRLYLAETDPEWGADELELPVQRGETRREVVA